MVRTLLLSTLLLVAHGELVARGNVRATSQADHPLALAWVRTSSGWERPKDWSLPNRRPRPALHPFVVAGGQLMGSLFALLAFSSASPAANEG